MKKTITTLSISLLLALSAQATDISGNVTIPTSGTSYTDKLVVTGAGTMTGGELTFMNITSTGDIALINDDYTFSNKVNVSASGSTNPTWANIKIAQGKTVEFADFNTSKMVMTSRAGVVFAASSGTNDQTLYANIWLNSSDTNVFQKKTGQTGGYEIWLNYVNFHSEVSAATKYAYVHFQYGANFICENNASFNTIAVRQSYKQSDTYLASNAFAGRVQMNGYDVTVNAIEFNPTNNNAYTDFYVDFGVNSEAQTFVTNSVSKNSDQYCNKDMIKLIVENFGEGDQLLVKNGISETLLPILSINGLSGSDIKIEQLTSGDYAGYWSYSVTVVPEPSTYALIFGALALGFVAYRRRK